MPHSLGQIYLHLVFSTKHRFPYLEEPRLRRAMHGCLATICERVGSRALEVGGVADHVHIACRLSRQSAVADLARRLKNDSSRWIKREFPSMSSFYWQTGYGAFSVSPGHIPALRRYIANQEEHHRHESFDIEMHRLLEKYGIDGEETDWRH